MSKPDNRFNKRINVGSLNKNKIGAVAEVFPGYEVVGISCDSGVRDQPLNMEETIKGAVNRAKSVFCDCEYSAGIEDGITPVPCTKSGYMNFCCCCIYDGTDTYLGISSGFEYPPVCIERVLTGGMDISQAFEPITNDPEIGSGSGIIGWLTKGKIRRLEYTKQAVLMAVIIMENRLLYYS